MIKNETISLISVPIFTGLIGYVTNWTGVWMLFNPVRFKGFRLPGLMAVAKVLPRKIQQVPGIMQGGVGWQGIVPSRAAKMGSIAVDKGIAKIGSPSDFYDQLEPDKLAQHILDSSRGDIRETVERIIQREHPQLWRDLPPRAREAVHERVQAQLPDLVHEITDEIGENIDQLLDVKLMVIRRLEERPELANRIFTEVGQRELKLIINFGFLFGFIQGIPTTVLTVVIFPDAWWLLPLCGIVIGWVTNWVALLMIFEPPEPKKVGPFTLHGLFIKRQPEVSGVYANIVSEEIINLQNIGNELMEGPRSDRTRLLVETAMRPAVDRAVGRARPAVRVAMGADEYDAIRDSLAAEAVGHTMDPLTDPELNERQAERMRELVTPRIEDLPPEDFAELLRSGFKEDEWLLLLHGAVLGLVGGLLHLALFG